MKAPIIPHITEKSYRAIDSSKNGATYTFKVNPRLTKEDVRRMIEREYKVSVENVSIVRLPGKVRRFKGIVGRTNATKKALVRLKKGDTIAAFDVPENTTTDTKE